MAIPRQAQVAALTALGPDTRLADLVSDEPLGFTGGQYIIVDSGLVQPSGKAVKRAYSMLTPETEQRRFQIAVKHLPGGPGSGFILALEAGATLRFSGPWGRFFPPNGVTGPTLVLATDTGITAALGLAQGGPAESPDVERAGPVHARADEVFRWGWNDGSTDKSGKDIKRVIDYIAGVSVALTTHAAGAPTSRIMFVLGISEIDNDAGAVLLKDTEVVCGSRRVRARRRSRWRQLGMDLYRFAESRQVLPLTVEPGGSFAARLVQARNTLPPGIRGSSKSAETTLERVSQM